MDRRVWQYLLTFQESERYGYVRVVLNKHEPFSVFWTPLRVRSLDFLSFAS